MSEPKAIVFVVDDDESVRESLGSLIRSEGMRVETFASAQQFLAGPRSETVERAELSSAGYASPGTERA